MSGLFLSLYFSNRIWRLRAKRWFFLICRRFIYLTGVFFIFAILALPFQSVALGCISGGLFKVDYHQLVESIYTRSNVIWCLTACMLTAVLLIRYDRKLRSLLIVATSWAFSLIFADTFVDGILPSTRSPLALNILFFLDYLSDIIGALIVAFLLTKMLRNSHPWVHFRSSKFNRLVYQNNISGFSLRALSTGWTGLFLITMYWVWLIFGLFLALFSYFKIALFCQAAQQLHWKDWLRYDWRSLVVYEIIFLGYIPFLILIRSMIYAVFIYSKSISRLYFYISIFLYFVILTYFLYFKIQLFLSVPFDHNLLFFALLISGFWYSAQDASIRNAGTRSLKINRNIFPFLRLMKLSSEYNPFKVWMHSVLKPVSIMKDILSSKDNGFLNPQLIKLSWSSVQITFLVSTPIVYLYHLPLTDFRHKIVEYSFLLISLLLGGIVYHFVFKMLSKPSDLFSTVVIYAVPQLLFMPLFSALSIVLLNAHYIRIETLKLEHLSDFVMLKSIFSIQFGSYQTNSYLELINFAESFILGTIQIFFLEIYCQYYQTSRQESYKVGLIGGIINGLVLAVTVSPIRDIFLYYMI